MVIGPAQVEHAETPSLNQNTSKYGHLPNQIIEDSDQNGTLSDFDPRSLYDYQSPPLRYSPVPSGLVPRPGRGGWHGVPADFDCVEE